MRSKRAAILALFKHETPISTIVTDATNPPADADYQCRLRLWAADCVCHALRQMPHGFTNYNAVRLTIDATRGLASAQDLPQALRFYSNPDYAALFAENERSNYTAQAELNLAAAMSVHRNGYLGALGAATHARRAMLSVDGCDGMMPGLNELNWQTDSLNQWMSDDQPLPFKPNHNLR